MWLQNPKTQVPELKESTETKHDTKNNELHVLCSFITYTVVSFDSHTVLVPQQKSNFHYFMFVLDNNSAVLEKKDVRL